MKGDHMFNNYLLEEGPGSYEDLCELHRQITKYLIKELTSINNGTCKGDNDHISRMLRCSILFLKNNRITCSKGTPMTEQVNMLESLELPEFGDELKN